MSRRRVRLIVEVDLDPVPGWGDNPEDWQRLVESRMGEHWYHPTVTIDRVIEPKRPSPFADALEREAEASAAVANALAEKPRHQPASSFGYAYCAVCRADWPCHAAKEQA